MLCEKCGKKTATHSYTQIINGVQTHMNLCPDCAGDYDLKSVFNDFNYGFSDLMNSFFNIGNMQTQNKINQAKQPNGEVKRCKKCSKSYEDIAKSGKIGCAECYNEFKEYLIPSIEKLHGKVNHVGKIPTSADANIKVKHKIKTLKKQLNDCVQNQEFEQAAKLRDEINELEDNIKGGDNNE